MKSVFVTSVLLATFAANSQTLTVDWSRLFPFPGDDITYLKNVRIDDLGNIYCCGNTYTAEVPPFIAASNNPVVVKFSPAGILLWKKIFSVDSAWCPDIAFSPESQRILVLIKKSSQSASWIVVLSNHGDSIGTLSTAPPNASKLAVRNSYGYLAQTRESPSRVFAFDSTGLGLPGFEFHSYATTIGDMKYASGSIFLFGQDYSGGPNTNSAVYGFRYTPTSSSAALLNWKFKQGDAIQGYGYVDDDLNSYVSMITLGYRNSLVYQVFVTAKLDPNGNELWRREWDGDYSVPGTHVEAFLDGNIGYPSGGVLVFGTVLKNTFLNNARDCALIAYDSDGSMKWKSVFRIREDYPFHEVVGAAWTSNNRLILLCRLSPNTEGGDNSYALRQVRVPDNAVSVGNYSTGSIDFVMNPIYPNPFNSTATISFDTPVRCWVEISVVNAIGQQVALLQNAELDRGHHRVAWTPTSASGAYFIVVHAVAVDNPSLRYRQVHTALLLR